MTFRWFTSLPTFVAQQISYVADATELIRLKMFRKRIRDKIDELESRSMEKFAETHPEDNENLSRIGKHMSILSEAVKCWKTAISPDDKNLLRKGSKSTSISSKSKSKDDFCRALFVSDSEEEMDSKKPQIKKAINVPNLVKRSADQKSDCIYDSALRSDDLQKLPSTQDIDRVFQNWKESKNCKKTENETRVEKRKRSSSGSSVRKMKSKKLLRVSHCFSDDDDDFQSAIADSRLSVSDNHTSIETDEDGTDIIEQTRFPAKNNRASNIRLNGRLLELPKNKEESYSKTHISNTVAHDDDLSSKMNVISSTAERSLNSSNSFDRSNTELLKSVSHVPATLANNLTNFSASLSRVPDTLPNNTNNFSTSPSRVPNTFTNSASSFSSSFNHLPKTFGANTESSKRDSTDSCTGQKSDMFINKTLDDSPSTVACTPLVNSKFKMKVPVLSKNLNITAALANSITQNDTLSISNSTLSGEKTNLISTISPYQTNVQTKVMSNSSHLSPNSSNNDHAGSRLKSVYSGPNASGTCGASEYDKKSDYSADFVSFSNNGFLDDLIDSEVIREFDCLDDEMASGVKSD